MINHTNPWQLFAETVNHLQAYQTLLEAGDTMKNLETYEALTGGFMDYLFDHNRSPFNDQAPEEKNVDEGYDSGCTEEGVPYNPEETQRLLAKLWESDEYELLVGAFEGNIVEVNLLRAGMPIGSATMSFGAYHTIEEFAEAAGYDGEDEGEDGTLHLGEGSN